MAKDLWRKGRALDLWSIPHFLFGVLMSFLPQLLNWSFSTAFMLTIILALAWEIYEKFVEIKETILNSLFDIFLPIVAFVCTSQLLRTYPIHYADLVVVTVAVFIVFLFTNISGWAAYRRRQKGFMH